ncbi:unnamed protein product [Calypogeia fissa]
MEVAMAAAGCVVVVNLPTFRAVGSASATMKLFSNQTVTIQPQSSMLQPLRDRISNFRDQISERRGAPSLPPQFNLLHGGCSDGEDRPARSRHFHESLSASSSFQRREVLGKATALMLSALSFPAIAAEDNFTLYQDEEDKYSILVPQEWTKGEGKAGTRKVTAFFPESDSSANVNILITGLGADYTALGSFGTVDIFAENLVNSLDRAWQRPKGQAAKLIEARSRNGMYYIEYTIQKPGEAKRHLLSVVGMASNGWINRLYTVTGQYWEDDGDKYRASLEKAISSFRFA